MSYTPYEELELLLKGIDLSSSLNSATYLSIMGTLIKRSPSGFEDLGTTLSSESPKTTLSSCLDDESDFDKITIGSIDDPLPPDCLVVEVEISALGNASREWNNLYSELKEDEHECVEVIGEPCDDCLARLPVEKADGSSTSAKTHRVNPYQIFSPGDFTIIGNSPNQSGGMIPADAGESETERKFRLKLNGEKDVDRSVISGEPDGGPRKPIADNESDIAKRLRLLEEQKRKRVQGTPELSEQSLEAAKDLFRISKSWNRRLDLGEETYEKEHYF